jgi:hypothetical protein
MRVLRCKRASVGLRPHTRWRRGLRGPAVLLLYIVLGPKFFFVWIAEVSTEPQEELAVGCSDGRSRSTG